MEQQEPPSCDKSLPCHQWLIQPRGLRAHIKAKHSALFPHCQESVLRTHHSSKALRHGPGLARHEAHRTLIPLAADENHTMAEVHVRAHPASSEGAQRPGSERAGNQAGSVRLQSRLQVSKWKWSNQEGTMKTMEDREPLPARRVIEIARELTTLSVKPQLLNRFHATRQLQGRWRDRRQPGSWKWVGEEKPTARFWELLQLL